MWILSNDDDDTFELCSIRQIIMILRVLCARNCWILVELSNFLPPNIKSPNCLYICTQHCNVLWKLKIWYIIYIYLKPIFYNTDILNIFILQVIFRNNKFYFCENVKPHLFYSLAYKLYVDYEVNWCSSHICCCFCI